MSVCDNTSVGVVIGDADGRLLLFRRARFPWGIAPVAGHVDDHGGPEAAARAEVAEEVGLTVTELTHVAGGWRDNRCRRQPGPQGIGHLWHVYRADVTGQVTAAADEAVDAAWFTPAQVQALADRTVAYAHGKIPAGEFEAAPGLEPVWVQWFTDLGLITQCPGAAPTQTTTTVDAGRDSDH